MRKARIKKEQKEAVNTEPSSDNLDESAAQATAPPAPPPTTSHHQGDEGISLTG